MNAVLIGADRLGNIPERLAALGIHIVRHITGRDSTHQRKLPSIPRDAQLVILFTDFLGHNVMKSFRSRAEAGGVKVVACRRSATCLEAELQRCLGQSVDRCAVCPAKAGARG